MADHTQTDMFLLNLQVQTTSISNLIFLALKNRPDMDPHVKDVLVIAESHMKLLMAVCQNQEKTYRELFDRVEEIFPS